MIDKLEMFIALANERHFGRAAEVCGVTQPSLSGAIRQLEDQLGVQLVWRGSRFQGLTPEGQRVLEWALRIVADARTLREEMRAARQGLAGNLRIGVIPTALSMIVDLTAGFAARHPNVHLTILSRSSHEILTALDRLELDAGITYLENEPLGRVTRVPLFHESYGLLVAPGHPLAGAARTSWAEVARLPLCLLTPDMQNRRILNHHMNGAGVEARARIESNSVITLAAHVATGDWASVLPSRMAELLTGPRLVAVPIDDPSARHPVGLITPEREPHTPVIAALLDAARRLPDLDGGKAPGGSR
ncbi:LysR family transcriptional regulator [Halodurantibacterium flavum]|uniref:LysR family transcriptional regulator n=1 Tax=Halodurantibacterium flavum TaxID=1382802 RepID=A0ABW4S829_9RHOB